MNPEVKTVEAGASIFRKTQDQLDPAEQSQPEASVVRSEVSRHERNRLIAHLGRTFARRYDIQVLPSRQRGVWACGLDPKVTPEMERYIQGDRDTLDDLPPESFTPKQILYDEQAASEMSMEQITTILHHEAGHAKYTDFRLMFEGQRQAKDEGYLPTSFWLAFEGIEDPRVNSLEGEESPAIDRQIRANQGKDLQDRITEAPLSQKPMMLQFAYNSFHYWLHGEGIPELAGTDVGRLGELAKPLLQQYFENTDVEQRRLLQQKIWDISKELEKKEIEQEEKRQMAQQKGQQGQSGQSQGGGEDQQSAGQQGNSSGEQQSGGGQSGQGESQPGIPSGRSFGGQGQGSGETPNRQGQDNQSQGENQQQGGRKGFLNKLRDTFFGQKNSDSSGQEDSQQSSSEGKQSSDGQSQEQGHQLGKPEKKQKPEKIDLSKLSPEELQQIQDAIDQLTPAERAELAKKARVAVDEEQKEALGEELGRTMQLEKNQQTGEYEVKPQTATDKEQKQAQADYQQAVQEVEAEEQAEWEREEQERRQQEQVFKQLEAQRREKLEMEKAGFDPNEREKFLLYQSLEDSMYSNIRNFKQAIEKVIPRRREPVYEGGYFSGSKFDRRDLVRKAPLGNEQFHMRQVERPIGDPRLFIGLVVDNSGSMSGAKMDQARRTMIFFSKVCKDMGIPFMASAFGDDAEVIKQFRQDFDNPAERIKPKIIDATAASGGSTNLHAGLDVTIEAMNEQRRRLRDSHGLVFVITDGGANAGLTGDVLRNYIEENRGRLTFKAFGLSGSDHERDSIQNYLNNYFGESNCAYPEGFDSLPDEAFRVLRVNLMQFQRFLS